jgi:PHD/YefM family antitoxin component YafN of YafNO toxin-antitoxin module
MIRATDIHSLTDFTGSARAYVQQIRESKSPITVNGTAQVVIQDAESFQRMIDELEHARFIAAMRVSEADVKAGRVQNLDEAFDGIVDELGL